MRCVLQHGNVGSELVTIAAMLSLYRRNLFDTDPAPEWAAYTDGAPRPGSGV